MRHHTDFFTGTANTRIFTQHWLPDHDADVRAFVVIAHGIGEHTDRYAHVADRLVGHGYGVFALDHRGHGRSDGERVIVTDFDDEYVADLRAFVADIQGRYPGKSLFVYGHSMGSLIALLYAFRYQDELAGLITTGTALKPMRSNAVTVPIIKTASSLIPGARLIPVDADGISRDPAVCRAYRDDPLVYHGRIPLVSLAALQAAADQCIQHLPELRIPYLAMHGSDDPLTLVKGAQLVRERCGSRDTEVKIYEGLYHEIHNEPEQDRVLADMVGWLDNHVGLA